MGKALTQIQKRLVVATSISFALTPIIACSIAVMFDRLQVSDLLNIKTGLPLLLAYLGLVALVARHFHWFTRPFLNWVAEHPYGHNTPEHLIRHLKSFTRRYWSFYLVAVISLPLLMHWSGVTFENASASPSLLEILLLNLVVAIYIGMPGYLYSLNILGNLNHYIGIAGVHINIQTKILLVGAYLPILSGTVLLKYYWWRTGFLTSEVILAWGLIGLLAVLVTTAAIRSLHQSLSPVKKVTSRGGATSYKKLANQLRPESLDEIGYLVQMLGNMFKRLVQQESHVSAIVDHAAEGVIVLDDQQNIDTFNPAAEKLFGYKGVEIRGRPIHWLIPNFDAATDANLEPDNEHEVFGRHNNGSSVPMRVRVSQMQRDDLTYFTLLVADISERKAAQRMLLEAEARYRNLVETAHDLVWSVDTEGRWVYLNNAVTSIYGYKPDEMLGYTFMEFQASESKERDARAFEKVLSGEDLLQYETVHLDKQGNRRYISFNARPTKNDKGEVILISGTARDITEQKQFEEELTYQAQHDNLTGLHNRSYFQSELERVTSRVARSAAECALLYLDLDQFKYVNDTVGHAAGDRLLKECTELLKKNIRDGDLLARFGGDEFTIILYNIDHDHAIPVAENIRSMFEHYRFYDNGKTFNVTCSIGLAMIDSSTKSAEEALSRADLACNISKNQGRNCVHEYSDQDSERTAMVEDVGWVNRVHDAIENDRFQLVYQPILSVASGDINGYEVLLRLPTEDGESIRPSGFIPAAERFGLMHNLDRWTVRQAMEHLAELQSNNIETRFSINLSGRAVDDAELLKMIKGILRDSGLNPGSLTFEITETAAIANLKAARRFINNFKDLGCHMALDDFGSGFCSFSYLKNLPVDTLKIDGSLVQSLATTRVDQAMVQSMNQIAHALGKTTTAEYVENQETLMLLKEYGVDYAQGHFIGKPDSKLIHSVNTGNISDAPLSA
jgi:diguanylate cyclase (GGDEF)-like protein/PAS domain S-box-containing protein